MTWLALERAVVEVTENQDSCFLDCMTMTNLEKLAGEVVEEELENPVYEPHLCQ